MSADRVINKGGRPKGSIETEKHAAINITQREFLVGTVFEVVGMPSNTKFRLQESKNGYEIQYQVIGMANWFYYSMFNLETKKAYTYNGLFGKKQEVKISFAEK